MTTLVDRVRDILLKPKETWPAIAAEPVDAAQIYSKYLVILAAIGPICGLIGLAAFGIGGMGVSIRLPIGFLITQAVVSYVLTLAMIYVVALIVDALAPTFGATRSRIQALKLVAYASTAALVAGVFSLIPALAIIGLLAGLYSLYLLYLGIGPLMNTPSGKAGAYTAVVIVCAIVAGIVVAALSALVLPRGPMAVGGLPGAAARGDGAEVSLKTPDGSTVTINSANMAEMAKRMEEAGKRMEAAQKSGDGTAANKAMGDIVGAMGGSGGGAPIPSADLKAMLPESIGGLKRSGVEAQSGSAMGISGSTAKATYGDGSGKRVDLQVVDSGGLAGLATMAWAQVTMDKETDGKIERVYKDGARTVHEEYRKDGSQAEVTVILANGVVVSAEGHGGIDIGAVKGAVAGIDLGRLEKTARAAR